MLIFPVVYSLTAGEMALWLGPGRKVFERIWERPVLGVELCGALSDLNWGGWKMLALPHVLKLAPELLQSHTAKTLELLVAVHREGRLENVDVAWKGKLQKWVDGRFAAWDGSTDKASTVRRLCAPFRV